MEISWKITTDDINKLKSIVGQQQDNYFVRSRISRNIDNPPKRVIKKNVWFWMVSCLLTTQQRSGPNTPVNRFIHAKPFQLNYERCLSLINNREEIARTIAVAGIRMNLRLSDLIVRNLDILESNGWPILISQLQGLVGKDSPGEERKVATYILNEFKGFGPKQSRNLLQSLGLTKHEIPIDSRIVKWLNEFGFPVTLSATALGDPGYYNFVSDAIQMLCRKSKIYPAVLDASIFSSFDKEEWTRKNVY